MFVVLYLLVGADCARGQVTVRLSEQARASIPAQVQREIQDAVAPLIRQYEVLLRSVIDVDNRSIDREKALRFEKLFSLDAMVINDLREEPEEIPVGIITYMEFVEDYFTEVGVDFSITSAEIVNVSYAPSNSYYNVDVRVGKSVRNFIPARGTVERGERDYNLKFNVTLRRGEPASARISTINLPGGVFAADYLSYLGFGATVGRGSAAFGESSVLANPATSGGFDLDGNLHLGAGLYYMSNFFAPKGAAAKRLYLVGRLGLTNTRLTGTLTDYATSAPFTVTGQTADEVVFTTMQRDVTGLEASEDNSLTSIQAGLGLSYNVHAGKKSSVFISAEYAPSYLISGGGSVSGGGNYRITQAERLPDGTELVFSSSAPRAYDPESGFASSYDVGELAFRGDTELESSLSHGILLSATFMRDALADSPTYGIGFGAQYYLPLTNTYGRAADFEDTPFLYTDATDRRYVDPGLLGVLDVDTRISHFGVWLSVYLKKSRRP